MSNIFGTKPIFFLCNPDDGPPDQKAYQHNLVCLGEGFKAIGVPFFADTNYWQLASEDGQYLFSHHPDITLEDCSVVVVSAQWFNYRVVEFPQFLFRPNRQYRTVYIDNDDGKITRAWQPQFRQFDFVLKTHYNQNYKYPTNFFPWAFGLSNRILAELENLLPTEQRSNCLLFNFRAHHMLRDFIRENFLPLIAAILSIDSTVDQFDAPPESSYHHVQWLQTGRRHYPHYYQRLVSTVANACFGGQFSPKPPLDSILPLRYFYRLYYMLSTWLPLPTAIYNWDSWRFWESLAAGCVAFHLDFERYGFQLPVMPTNWEHYIGVDMDNLQAAVDHLVEQPDLLPKIGMAGRQWAIEHYAPVPTADRFLRLVLR